MSLKTNIGSTPAKNIEINDSPNLIEIPAFTSFIPLTTNLPTELEFLPEIDRNDQTTVLEIEAEKKYSISGLELPGKLANDFEVIDPNKIRDSSFISQASRDINSINFRKEINDDQISKARENTNNSSETKIEIPLLVPRNNPANGEITLSNDPHPQRKKWQQQELKDAFLELEKAGLIPEGVSLQLDYEVEWNFDYILSFLERQCPHTLNVFESILKLKAGNYEKDIADILRDEAPFIESSLSPLFEILTRRHQRRIFLSDSLEIKDLLEKMDNISENEESEFAFRVFEKAWAFYQNHGDALYLSTFSHKLAKFSKDNLEKLLSDQKISQIVKEKLIIFLQNIPNENDLEAIEALSIIFKEPNFDSNPLTANEVQLVYNYVCKNLNEEFKTDNLSNLSPKEVRQKILLLSTLYKLCGRLDQAVEIFNADKGDQLNEMLSLAYLNRISHDISVNLLLQDYAKDAKLLLEACGYYGLKHDLENGSVGIDNEPIVNIIIETARLKPKADTFPIWCSILHNALALDFQGDIKKLFAEISVVLQVRITLSRLNKQDFSRYILTFQQPTWGEFVNLLQNANDRLFEIDEEEKSAWLTRERTKYLNSFNDRLKGYLSSITSHNFTKEKRQDFIVTIINGLNLDGCIKEQRLPTNEENSSDNPDLERLDKNFIEYDFAGIAMFLGFLQLNPLAHTACKEAFNEANISQQSVIYQAIKTLLIYPLNESDNNVFARRLVKVFDLEEKTELTKVLKEASMEILEILSSGKNPVTQEELSIAELQKYNQSLGSIFIFLQEETRAGKFQETEYQQLLIKALSLLPKIAEAIKNSNDTLNHNKEVSLDIADNYLGTIKLFFVNGAHSLTADKTLGKIIEEQEFANSKSWRAWKSELKELLSLAITVDPTIGTQLAFLVKRINYANTDFFAQIVKDVFYNFAIQDEASSDELILAIEFFKKFQKSDNPEDPINIAIEESLAEILDEFKKANNTIQVKEVKNSIEERFGESFLESIQRKRKTKDPAD